MSLSKPFFGSKYTYKPKQIVPYMSNAEYNALHWTRQLELRPLGTRKRWENAEGDFNTSIDMWDDNEILDKEITT